MSSDTSLSDVGETLGRIRKYAVWGFGGLFSFFGGIMVLGMFTESGFDILRALIGGLLFLFAGLLTLPPTRPYLVSQLSERTGRQIGGTMLVGIVAIGLFLGLAVVGSMPQEAPSDASPAGDGPDGAGTPANTTSTETWTETTTDMDASASPTHVATDAPSGTTAPVRTTAPPVQETATATATATPTPQSTATRSPTPRSTTTPAAAAPTPSGDDADVVLRTIQYTGEGSDHENPNNEWVTFENTGDGAVNLQGWMVGDATQSHRYHFQDVTLQPGDTIRLYTGGGSDTDSEVYWRSSRAIWNDDGDTVRLWNDDGELIVEYEYSGDENDGSASP